MKLRTNTLILAIAACLAAGGLVYWEVSQSNRPQEIAEQESKANLFNFQEDDVVQLTVTPQKDTTLIFERTSESFPNTWKMTQPKEVVADEAAITFLLDQLASSKTQNTLTVEKSQWPDFGIGPDNPQTQVTLKNGASHQLLLGGETFNQQHLYALADTLPPLPDAVEVSIVSTTLLDAIQRPLAEWEYDPNDLPSVPADDLQSPSAPKLPSSESE